MMLGMDGFELAGRIRADSTIAYPLIRRYMGG